MVFLGLSLIVFFHDHTYLLRLADFTVVFNNTMRYKLLNRLIYSNSISFEVIIPEVLFEICSDPRRVLASCLSDFLLQFS